MDEVISIDPKEVSPERLGLDQRAVDAIWEDTLSLYRSGMHPMLSLCIRRSGIRQRLLAVPWRHTVESVDADCDHQSTSTRM